MAQSHGDCGQDLGGLEEGHYFEALTCSPTITWSVLDGGTAHRLSQSAVPRKSMTNLLRVF